MSQVLLVNRMRKDEIIIDAARRGTQVILTRHDDLGWQVCKSRFVGCDEDRQRLYIARPPGGRAAAWADPLTGELVGVTFRRGHKKCLFNASVTGFEEQGGARLEVGWPEQLQELQRRAFQRAAPPPGRQIKVHFQRKDGVGEDEVRVGVLEDLSAGGIRVRSAAGGDLRADDTVRLTFALRRHGPQLTLDGIFRHRESRREGPCSLGFQFVGLETSAEGQDTLAAIARVVADFQRAGLRRERSLRRASHPR